MMNSQKTGQNSEDVVLLTETLETDLVAGQKSSMKEEEKTKV